MTSTDLIMEFSTVNSNVTPSMDIDTTGREESEATTQDIFMEEAKSYSIFKIANVIKIYWFPVLIPVGLVGNTLSFIVMIKPNNRKMSTCIYMAAISINDNIMMCMCFHDYLVSVVQIHEWNSMECKISGLIFLSALQNETFQVLAMTLDKYIAIRWPHKAAMYSTPERAKMTTVCLYIFTFIYNIPHLFLSGMIGELCVSYGISSIFSKVHSWLSFVLNAIIPFTLLIHMNFVIMKTVRNSRKMFRKNDVNTGMDSRQNFMKSAENQLTIMLLLVTTLFFIFLCPTYVRFIYLLLAQPDTPFAYANSVILFEVTYKLYTSNSGLNFFLYCISGKKFRNDLKEMCCCCRRKNQLQSSTTSVTIQTGRVLNHI